MTIKIDILTLFPANVLPTEDKIVAVHEFIEAEGRLPTEPEMETLVGVAVDHGARTDPLPDGFGGRNWNNPNWLQRLVRQSG